MEFAPQKSELMHFTRAHAPCQERVRLGDTEIAPTTKARFLRVWLDRKLKWKAHLLKNTRRGRLGGAYTTTKKAGITERKHGWVKEWHDPGTPRRVLLVKWDTKWRSLEAATDPQRTCDVPASGVPPEKNKGIARYKGLLKHEASLLMQVRTEKVGLGAFLFQRKVPGVSTPRCRCGDAKETDRFPMYSLAQQIGEGTDAIRTLFDPG